VIGVVVNYICALQWNFVSRPSNSWRAGSLDTPRRMSHGWLSVHLRIYCTPSYHAGKPNVQFISTLRPPDVLFLAVTLRLCSLCAFPRKVINIMPVTCTIQIVYNYGFKRTTIPGALPYPCLPTPSRAPFILTGSQGNRFCLSMK
jgi:hypothetical protein